ncbi:MAG: DUF2269 domain-containing protein [Gammaproteobacteria bacterium]|nr:DUF2269 domain-containing protein [Gammaproteobacteria bacterium]MDH5651971.1 DUF2269 domain-containing protein [Gammaproteobacteria bacterium]
MDYLLLKTLHILSATILFGTGLGSAFYKYMADRSGDIVHIARTNRLVVLADWLFTTPTIILQAVTGILLAQAAGYPLTSHWLMIAIALYLLAGACWLPVVVLQIRMRDMAMHAVNDNTTLPYEYYRYARFWFWLGVPAFLGLVVVFYLMVAKPG